MIHRVVVGHMLGDGHIAKVQKGNSYFCIHRKAGHHEYNLWTKRSLIESKIIVTETYPKLKESGGKSFPSSYLRTGRNSFWNKQRSLWYKNGIKVIPKDYVKEHFDDLSFMLWFLDDGDCQGRLSTDSFSKDECVFLKTLIKDRYGIRLNQYHQTGREHHIVLVVPKKDRKKLKAIYQSLGIVIPCMEYKLGLSETAK